MEIAFTTPSQTGTSNDILCVVTSDGAPRKGETVEIDDFIYLVEDVEWHLVIAENAGVEADYPVGSVMDVIVRLKKVGEA